jgi:hypothetical protein
MKNLEYDMELLKTTGGAGKEELDQIKQEYYFYRQQNMNGDT